MLAGSGRIPPFLECKTHQLRTRPTIGGRGDSWPHGAPGRKREPPTAGRSLDTFARGSCMRSVRGHPQHGARRSVVGHPASGRRDGRQVEGAGQRVLQIRAVGTRDVLAVEVDVVVANHRRADGRTEPREGIHVLGPRCRVTARSHSGEGGPGDTHRGGTRLDVVGMLSQASRPRPGQQRDAAEVDHPPARRDHGRVQVGQARLPRPTVVSKVQGRDHQEVRGGAAGSW